MTRRRPGDYCRSCIEKDSGQKPEAKMKVVYAYSKKTVSSQSKLLNPYYVAQHPGEDEDDDKDFDDDDDEDFDDEDEDSDDDNFEGEDDEEDRREGKSSRRGSSAQASKKTPKPSKLPSKRK